VVKGISRRVIVVRSPDQRFFEQAIFLLREDALGPGTVTEERVVRQARQAATLYVQRTAPHGPGARVLPGWAWFALGACTMALVWWLTLAL
jgi:hypothetical protein